MRIKQARQLCPEVIQVPARPYRYAQVSTDIMSELRLVTPDVEVFSVDEAFLDVTRCQKIYDSPVEAGKMAQQLVCDVSGVTCSVGISGDKTTAKHAAKTAKKAGTDGLFSVPPWKAREYLSALPVTELSGISTGIGNYLNDRGVHVCGDMHNFPIGELAGRFGNLGRRIWYMAQGQDPELVKQSVAAPKSIGHGKVMPPNTKSLTAVKMYLHHMVEKVAARLRKHQLEAQIYFIGLKTSEGWLALKMQTYIPTNDSQLIKKLVNTFLRDIWDKKGCSQVQVTALDPKLEGYQLSLFENHDSQRDQINLAMDKINQRYGEFTLAPANLIKRSQMPNVIAPAWKPFGHRKTV